MYEFECQKCHNIYETDEVIENERTICKSCLRKTRTNYYLYIAYIIIILGFLSGIISGSIFSICKNSSIYFDSKCDEKIFNTAVMFYIWIGSFLTSVFVFSIHSICKRLDDLIDKE